MISTGRHQETNCDGTLAQILIVLLFTCTSGPPGQMI